MTDTVLKLRRRARWMLNRQGWQRRSSRLPRDPQGKLMLHVGCGDVDAPGYINIDARPMPHVHFVIDDLRDIDFVPPASVDLVYMCHVLEHVRHPEVGSVLRAAHSILRPGGTLRLAVPDFDLILDIYGRTNREMDSILGVMMGNQDYPQNAHYTAFNAASLEHRMQSSGFKDVRPWEADRVEHHAFSDTSNSPYSYLGRDYPISLNLEATRP